MPNRAWPPNPYDFSGPAEDIRFAGRSNEKVALRRFVDSISDASQGHLLIHGRRGIGKTSLLGQLSLAADNRGLLVASLQLDDSSASESVFVTESITAIATAVIEAGGLGGPGGEYEVALEQALLGRPVDPHSGPLRVIQFTSSKDMTRGIPDSFITKDLADLVDGAREVDRLGVVLVIDEGDRLVTHPSTIQKIRNLFILTRLVSTVLVGTDDLVRALDVSLAPAGRHFHRIELLPLADREETRECLSKPLAAVGLNPRSILSPGVIDEVHSLTRGGPFEIALIGHAMYDDLVGRGAGDLELSDQVLEAVAAQLRPSQEDQAALATLRTLDAEAVGLAAKYCVDPGLTAHEQALLTTAFNDPTPEALAASRSHVVSDWAKLAGLGLATQVGELLEPAFGEYARLYLKYRARVLDQLTEPVEGSYATRLSHLVDMEILRRARRTFDIAASVGRSHIALEGGTDPGTAKSLGYLQELRYNEFLLEGSPFAQLMMDLRTEDGPLDSGCWAFLLIPYEIGEYGFSQTLLIRSDGPLASVDELVADIRGFFEGTRGYQIRLGRDQQAHISGRLWVDLGRAFFAFTLGGLAASMWLKGRLEPGLKLAREVYAQVRQSLEERELLYEPELGLLNNIGFMEMASGHLPDALEAFERAAVRGGLGAARSAETRAILLCNLAAASAGLGRYLEALEWSDRVSQLTLTEDGPDVLIVFMPNPDWAKAPTVVRNPKPSSVAVGTRAAAMAMAGDEEAVDTCLSMVEVDRTGWGLELLRAIGEKLGRADVIARANAEMQSLASGDESM